MADDTFNPTRTPVSLLQELCQLNELTAEYKVLSMDGAVHAPTFNLRVKVEDDVAIESGASKKKAKHAAARAMLEKLLSKNGRFSEGFDSDGVIITVETLQELFGETKASVPIEDTGEKNAVSILQEKCVKKLWPPPLYETEKESGLPHEKLFQISCHIEGFKTIGSGKSKRLAKRESAEMMMKQLEDLKLIDQDDDVSSEKETSKLDEKSQMHLEGENEEKEDSKDDGNNECDEECQISNNSTEIKLPDSITVFEGEFE